MAFTPLLCIITIYFTFKAYKEKKVGSEIILVGFIIFIFTNLLTPLHLLRIIPTKPFTLEGSLILIASVTLALSRKRELIDQKLLSLEKKYSSELEKEVKEKTKDLELNNEELNKSNRMKTKLFSILAHDLRNPLFALEEVIFLFRNNHLTTKALRENINSVSQNLENNRFLLENLLQWSLVQLGYGSIKLERIDIEKLIQESILLYKVLADQKNIMFQVNIDAGKPCIADEGIIRLILRNLISNAIKFTGENGKIEIIYRRKKTLQCLIVKDTGIGISKLKLKNLFNQSQPEKIVLGKKAGSGLGLTLCKDFSERMNGKMSVVSEEKKGSKFTLTWKHNES